MLDKTKRTILTISVLGFLLVALPAPCFARWLSVTVTKERAKELGMKVQVKALGTDRISVRLEFPFPTKEEFKDFSKLELRISDGEKLLVTAPLQMIPSKEGRAIATFTAHRDYLDGITLKITVAYRPYAGTIYGLRVKDFVDLD